MYERRARIKRKEGKEKEGGRPVYVCVRECGVPVLLHGESEPQERDKKCKSGKDWETNKKQREKGKRNRKKRGGDKN